MAFVKEVTTNSLVLPWNYEVRRHPQRRDKDQQDRYFDLFDFNTIFSDVFQLGSEVIAVGPPYLNLLPFLNEGTWLVDGREMSQEKVFYSENKFVSFTRIDLSENYSEGRSAERLGFRQRGLDLETAISSNQDAAFSGKNVLLGINRNNDLEVLFDWIEVNSRANELRDVLLFDNRSDRYTIAELASHLEGLPSDINVTLVNWPMLFGPTGGPNQVWDSNFGEHIFREVARRRFLKSANTVMTADIDEVHLTETGEPIWKHVLSSPSGVFRYKIRNLSRQTTRKLAPGEQRKYRDFNYYDHSHPLNFKYAYEPSRLRDDQLLTVHYVSGVESFDDSPQAFARHFVGLRRDWRGGSFEYMNEPSGVGLVEGVYEDFPLAAVLRQDLGSLPS